MRNLLRALALGITEARGDVTTYFDPPLIDVYDLGREFARRAMRRS